MARVADSGSNPVVEFIDTTSCQFWIHNYRSASKVKKVTSTSWVAGGVSWWLTIYPHGREDKGQGKSISAYIAADEDPLKQERRDAVVKFSIPSGFVNIPDARYKYRKNKVKKHGYTKICGLADVKDHHLCMGSLVVRVELHPLQASPLNALQGKAAADEQVPDSLGEGSKSIMLHLKGDDGMKYYFNTLVFSDIVISTSCGVCFRCHRVVLAAASKPLAAMFTNGMMESRASEITLPTYSAPTVKAFLEFLYGLPVEVHETRQLYELCCMADQYAVDKLVEQCASSLEEKLRDGWQLHVDLACSILTTLSIPTLHKVHHAAWIYILMRLAASIEQPCFSQLPEEAIRQLLTLDPLRASEKLMLHALLTWIDANVDDRWMLYSELITYVRLYGMSMDELRESLELMVKYLHKWRAVEGETACDQARFLLLQLSATSCEISRLLMVKLDQAADEASKESEVEEEVAVATVAPTVSTRMQQLMHWFLCRRF